MFFALLGINFKGCFVKKSLFSITFCHQSLEFLEIQHGNGLVAVDLVYGRVDYFSSSSVPVHYITILVIEF